MCTATIRCGAALVVLCLGSAARADPPLPPPATGNVYFSSYGTDEILCHDPDGAYLFRFTHEDLSGPRGLAFSRAGELYVGSQKNDRVLVFDAEGAYSRQFTGGGLDGPTSLAFDALGQLFVSSFSSHEVLVFAGDEHVRTITAPGLSGPNCIAFAASGEFYVASQSTSQIFRFDADGAYVDKFTGGGLSSAMGIALWDGELYATGGSSHTVAVFDLAGMFRRNIDTRDWIPAPQGIAFDATGRFLVASFSTGRIARYDPTGGGDPEMFDDSDASVARSIAFQPVGDVVEAPFRRGDFNRDGGVNISDPMAVLGWLFSGQVPAGGAGACLDAADVNDDGSVNITDPIYALEYLFGGGAAPPAPFPDPGEDPTADGLLCPAG